MIEKEGRASSNTSDEFLIQLLSEKQESEKDREAGATHSHIRRFIWTNLVLGKPRGLWVLVIVIVIVIVIIKVIEK